jgi:hypothetical protein
VTSDASQSPDRGPPSKRVRREASGYLGDESDCEEARKGFGGVGGDEEEGARAVNVVA